MLTDPVSIPIHHLPFRPALEGYFASRFYEKARSLIEGDQAEDLIERVVREEWDWATSSERKRLNPKQRQIYRAVWLVFRDLFRAGWQFRWNAGLEVAPPTIDSTATSLEEVRRAKQMIRQIMRPARLERIFEAREFISRMESPTKGSLASAPITDLVADSQTILADLERIANINSDEAKLKALRESFQPYLQLVKEDERCKYTNHKLGDIWRYFRLTWATPAETTPGRTLQYLIRDAARPLHPVVAIISLENSPLRITDRDDHIGWTLATFHSEVSRCTNEQDVREQFDRLLRYIAIAVDEIDMRGLCRANQCIRPQPKLIRRLVDISIEAELEYKQEIQSWKQFRENSAEGDYEEIESQRSDLGNISKKTEKALYLHKRAERLARLLTSKMEFQSLLARTDFATYWKTFLVSEAGQTAITVALQVMKNRHIGTSMLELNVCGAIPPYNDLLAGKLAALLATSPQVVTEYRERYGTRASDIATRMSGREIVRPAELLFIGTSSLYRIGSSQYNRLKLPQGLLRVGAPEVRWIKLGETSGYGTLHIGKLTVKCLEEAADSTYVNHIFGEGPSPKLRAIRQTLQTVFDPVSGVELTRHAMSRLVYGVWLASNGKDIFLGKEEEPNYYFSLSEPFEIGTEKIAEYWRQRWLIGRVGNQEVRQRLSTFRPQDLLVSRDLPSDSPLEFMPIIKEDPIMTDTSETEDGSWRDFVRGLYRGKSSYADNMDSQILERLHIETDLDKAVLSAISKGKSVVLTGNPGDGKTHILRVLQPRIEEFSPAGKKPAIVFDASTITNQELKRKWAKTYSDGRPFCLAINEAVLKSLADTYKDFAPIQDAQRQVEEAVVYDPVADSATRTSSVVVFDLSRRNVLAANIVVQILDKFTDSVALQRCAKCPAEGCDFALNQMLLRSSRVRERLQVLLDRVSRRGYHATLRELLAFLSYLLFAGRSCNDLILQTGDREHAFPYLPFTGTGALFNAITETFDPVTVSHPLWDEMLVYARGQQSEWLAEWPYETDKIAVDDHERFELRKRAFYFLHAHGDDLLQIAHDDESEFGRFLEMPQREALRLIIRRINLFFGDASGSDVLRVWQSHRYNQTPRGVLYSASTRQRVDFEIVLPVLRKEMKPGFDLAQDHVLLRLTKKRAVGLRIDYPLFEMLAQAERGLPMLSLDTDLTRRLWQFVEQLAEPSQRDEVQVTLLDPATGERIRVTVDTVEPKYLAIERGNSDNAYTH